MDKEGAVKKWKWSRSVFVTPWTIAYQASPSMGFSRQEYWSGLPFPSPGDIPDPGIKPRAPKLQADAYPLSHQGSPKTWYIYTIIQPLNTYSAIKKNEIAPFAATLIDLEIIILSKVSQKEKDKYHITYMRNLVQQIWTYTKQKQTHRYREQTCVCQGGGERGEGRNGSLGIAEATY